MDSTTATGDMAEEFRDDRAALEAALVARARTDPAAFEALYSVHQHAIWRYVRHRTGDAHAADDLVAEVFLDLLRALTSWPARRIVVRGWLYRVATRKVARWSKRRRTTTLDHDVEHAVDAVADPRTDLVRAALEMLPQRHQAVLVLHHVENLGVEEIAAALGLCVGTVKSRLSRGREELRKRLTDTGGAR